MKQRIMVLILCILFAPSLVVLNEVQALEYLDGDLVIHGKASEQLVMRIKNKRPYELYDYDIFHLRSTFKLETRWDALKGDKYDLTFYSVFTDFYDAAHDVDSGYEEYLRWGSGGNSRGIEEVKSYESFTDICRTVPSHLAVPQHHLRATRLAASDL